MRFFAHAHFDFIGNRYKAYVLSAAAIGLGIAFALAWQLQRGSWLNYGVDFTGGTLVQVRFEQPTSVGELRGVVAPAFPGSEITRFGGENEFLVRAPGFEGDAAKVSDQVVARLRGGLPGREFSVARTEAVGPKIGGELQQKAVLAIIFSFAVTLIYLALRFEWRFGVAAIIATLHDILITLGLLAALQLEVSLPTVAAVLTIIGYSLNDTIIVFDRVRENLHRTGRREAFFDTLNRSINETLPRTTLTAGTTLAALLSLFLFGGAIIRDFALILIVGIAVGTFSSIFVASPALLEIEKRWPRPTKTGKPRSAASSVRTATMPGTARKPARG
ncbi:MAG: protein translocase subunit SecF [Gemmatimonadetes bacterium]|nr:protein translocase subunit SecF [Gemmatimonadota bacterium]